MTTKKTTEGEKHRNSNRTSAAHKAHATRSRNVLGEKLKTDLKATREALHEARAAAKAELRLAKVAAKAEIEVLKDQLKAAQKREQALLKLTKDKTREMIKAGVIWEKQQMAKIKSIKAKRRS